MSSLGQIIFDELLAEQEKENSINKAMSEIDSNIIEGLDVFGRFEYLSSNFGEDIPSNEIVEKIDRAKTSKYLSVDTLIAFGSMNMYEFLNPVIKTISDSFLSNARAKLSECRSVKHSEYF